MTLTKRQRLLTVGELFLRWFVVGTAVALFFLGVWLSHRIIVLFDLGTRISQTPKDVSVGKFVRSFNQKIGWDILLLVVMAGFLLHWFILRRVLNSCVSVLVNNCAGAATLKYFVVMLEYTAFSTVLALSISHQWLENVMVLWLWCESVRLGLLLLTLLCCVPPPRPTRLASDVLAEDNERWMYNEHLDTNPESYALHASVCLSWLLWLFCVLVTFALVWGYPRSVDQWVWGYRELSTDITEEQHVFHAKFVWVVATVWYVCGAAIFHNFDPEVDGYQTVEGNELSDPNIRRGHPAYRNPKTKSLSPRKCCRCCRWVVQKSSRASAYLFMLLGVLAFLGIIFKLFVGEPTALTDAEHFY